MKISTTPNQTFLLYWVVAMLAVCAAVAAHTLSFDDEARQQELYCELAKDRAWPIDPAVYCEPTEEK